MSRYADYVRCEMFTGSVLYFPKEHAAKVKRKDKLVNEVMRLREAGFAYEASKLVSKIIRLNRSIPPCGITEDMYLRS